MEPLLVRLQKGPIVMDGAMGTLLMARGLRRDEPPDWWNSERPDEVRAVHRDYVAAGSKILFTNTFNVARLKFDGKLSADRAAELTRSGVRLAREAAGGKAYVAGDVGPIGSENMKKTTPSDIVLRYSEQAESLASAGVDLIVLETMMSLEQAQLALHAAREGTKGKIPVMLLMTLDEKGKTASGENIDPIFNIAEAMNVELVGFNCSYGPKSMAGAVAAMKKWPRLIPVVKPNAGVPGKTESLSPAEFSDQIRRLVSAGARIVGGCCGTTSDHIRALIPLLCKEG